jgi:hypothetical protein
MTSLGPDVVVLPKSRTPSICQVTELVKATVPFRGTLPTKEKSPSPAWPTTPGPVRVHVRLGTAGWSVGRRVAGVCPVFATDRLQPAGATAEPGT